MWNSLLTLEPVLTSSPFPFSTVPFFLNKLFLPSYYPCIPTPVLYSTRTWKSQWTLIHTCNTVNGNSYQGKEKQDPPSSHPHTEIVCLEALINQGTNQGTTWWKSRNSVKIELLLVHAFHLLPPLSD